MRFQAWIDGKVVVFFFFHEQRTFKTFHVRWRNILIFYFSFCNNRVRIFTNGHVHPRLVRMRVHAFTDSHTRERFTQILLIQIPYVSSCANLINFLLVVLAFIYNLTRIFYPSRRNTGSKFFGDLFLIF